MSNLKKATKQTFPKAFTPQELFADGSLGFAFDFRDPSLMFQDSGGVTPAEYGMPVGLVLDQSQGLRLSEELCHNGDFTKGEDGLEGWGKGSGKVLAKAENNEVEFTSPGVVGYSSGHWFYYQIGSMSDHFAFQVEFDAQYIKGGDLSVGMRHSSGGSRVKWAENRGIKSRYKFLVCGGEPGASRITFGGGPGSFTESTWRISNVSIKAILGNHAVQRTTTKRPILARSPRHGQIRNIIPNSESATAGWAGIGTTCLVEKHDDGIMRNALKFTHLTTSTNASISTSAVYPYPYPRENTNNVTSFYAKRGNCRYLGYSYVGDGAGFDFDTMSWFRRSYNATVEDVGGGWYLFTYYNSASGAGSSGFRIGFSNTRSSYVTPEPGDYGYIAYPQCEQIPSDLPPVRSNYQRTNGKYDITEQGVPDDTYLLFDGVDDALQTGEIKFGDNNVKDVTVWAGVRKLGSNTVRTVVTSGVGVNSANTFIMAAHAGSADTAGVYFGIYPRTVMENAAGYKSPALMTLAGRATQERQLVDLRINNTLETNLTSTTGVFTKINNDKVFIGCRGNDTSYLNGHLSSLTVVTKSVDDQTLQQVEQYTNNRTGAY